MPHKWELDNKSPARTQNVLSAPGAPRLVAIRVTSPVAAENQKHPHPWFLVYEPIREEFIDEVIAMFFGHQYDNSKHTWEKAGVNLPEARATATA
jgi:hypothetical protein